ncbi:TRAP transporter substrate-binding protein [Synechocystis sp. LKSZ1]|uniref:TRAP transporter substrate-binding protein n=1 Tax=Synechocystis sp. LKSZ1 TaxID=3144951 RepID=UPI00336BF205
MKRRTLLSQTGLALGTTAGLVACTKKTGVSTAQNSSLPKLRWRMVTSWPKSLETIFGEAENFCRRVGEMTGGNFTITAYAAGEIVPGLEVLDAVQNGTVECGHTASYYYIGKNAALGFACAMPFGLTAQQQNAWLYYGGGLEAIQKVYSDFNIINFPAGNTGAQMGGWFKQPINNLTDLKGLKMRIPGQGGQVMAELGVNVQVLPGSEIFIALDRGTIDAAEWVGPFDDEKLGLNKAAKYYYYPGWWEPGPTLDLLINKAMWAKLPKEYQAIIMTAAREANLNMLAQYDRLNAQSLQKLVSGGTQLQAYSPEILQAAQKASQALLESNASKDATFKAVYEPWQAFRQQIRAWNRINELSYANFVER